jgi:CheY-like chemotaxis protein
VTKPLKSPTGQPLHAFVVDDNAHMRDLLRRMLERIEIRTAGFPDGQAAYAAACRELPDIILADLNMAPMDGLTFTRLIRQGPDERLHHIPIVMITGQTELRVIEAARDTGVNEFLAKPVSATALYQRIEASIARPRPFIEAPAFHGPDRRRRKLPDFEGTERRARRPR